jgi:hypothetical protein
MRKFNKSNPGISCDVLRIGLNVTLINKQVLLVDEQPGSGKLGGGRLPESEASRQLDPRLKRPSAVHAGVAHQWES